jgi:1,2-diacylglycerol 3-beta-glucosyltransferase
MEPVKFPMISVLVAARNEAANIGSCLDALLNQNYPKNDFEIWVGDDQSTDSTAAIVRQYEKDYPNVHLLPVTTELTHLKGKANVLAQLAHKATGEYLFITDADMTLVPQWMTVMLNSFSQGTGIITGVTAVLGKGLFARLQNAEWLFYTGHGYYNALNGRPVTAMGNNMAVTTEAYRQTGGYENIPFSVTEDYELYRQVVKRGYAFRSLLEKDVLGFTHPIATIGGLIQQRRRWFTGALQLPKFLVAGLVILWVYLPIILITALFLGWWVGAALFLLKWLFDIFFLLKIYRKLGLKPDIATAVYTPFSMIGNPILLILQLIPGPVRWKGRKYVI